MKRSFLLLMLLALGVSALVMWRTYRQDQARSAAGSPRLGLASPVSPETEPAFTETDPTKFAGDFRRLSAAGTPSSAAEQHWIIDQWVRQNPETCFAFIQTLTEKEKMTALDHAFETLVRTDPSSGRRWLLQEGSGSFQPRLVSLLMLRDESRPPFFLFLVEQEKLISPESFQEAGTRFGSPGRFVQMAAAAMNIRDQEKRNAAFHGMADACDVSSVASAVGWVTQLKPGADRSLLAFGIARKILETNPTLFPEFLAALPPLTLKGMTQTLYKLYGQKAPELALAFLRGSGVGIVKNDNLPALVRGIASRDPRAVASWLKAEVAPGLRENLLELVIEEWADHDIEAVKQFVTHETTGRLRQTGMEKIVSVWVKKDPLGAAQFVIQLKDAPMRMFALEALRNNFDRLDTALVGQILQTVTDDRTKISWMTTAAEHSARHDVQAAIAWAQGLPGGKVQQEVFDKIAPIWAEKDPRGAWEFFAKNPDLFASDRTRDRILSAWVQSNPEELFQFSLGMKGEDQKKIMAASLATIANFKPGQSLEMLGQVTDPELQSGIKKELVSHFAFQQPEVAAQWVREFADGEEKMEALARVARGWGLKDVESTVAWMASLNQAELQRVIPSFVESADGGRPDLAAEWAARLERPEDRLKLVAHSMARWTEKSETAPFDWLQKSSLTPAEKQVILQATQRSRPNQR